MSDNLAEMKNKIINALPEKERFEAKGLLERHVDSIVSKRFAETGQIHGIESNSQEYKAYEKEEVERLLKESGEKGAIAVIKKIQQPIAIAEFNAALDKLAKNPTIEAVEHAKEVQEKAYRTFSSEANPREAFFNAYKDRYGDAGIKEVYKNWNDLDSVLIKELQSSNSATSLEKVAKIIDNRDGVVSDSERARIEKITTAAFGAVPYDYVGAEETNRPARGAAEDIENAIRNFKTIGSYNVTAADEVSLKTPAPFGSKQPTGKLEK